MSVVVLMDSHGSGQLHVMEPCPGGHQASKKDMSRELILKLIIYFSPLMPVQLDLQVIKKIGAS